MLPESSRFAKGGTRFMTGVPPTQVTAVCCLRRTPRRAGSELLLQQLGTRPFFILLKPQVYSKQGISKKETPRLVALRLYGGPMGI